MITSTDMEINKLILEISRTEKEIKKAEEAIGAIIRAEYIAGEDTLVELLLRHERLSEFWSTFEAHESIRDTIQVKASDLGTFRELLKEQRADNEKRRNKLTGLKDQYSEQNEVLVNNTQEQAQLLEVTKNEEQNYQQLLSSQKLRKNKS
jgi:peptidoglycan hydrolase CwlO-like protein